MDLQKGLIQTYKYLVQVTLKTKESHRWTKEYVYSYQELRVTHRGYPLLASKSSIRRLNRSNRRLYSLCGVWLLS